MIAYKEEVNELKNKIHEADIVSFDIFDTLLLRNVLQPRDIFKAVEVDHLNQFSNKIDFYKVRIQAEQRARQHSKEEDVLLDEIYYFVEKDLGPIANDLKRIEVNLEKKFIIANRQIKEVYELAKKLKKEIYIITDMYLPKHIIEELLKLNGIYDYDELFVSSELKVTKATGSMYQYIKTNKEINSELLWVHIGDNYQSDVVNAEKNGIKAHFYKKLSDRESVDDVKTLGESIIKAIQINNKYLTDKDYWYQFGNDYVAPIYIGLMKWLVKSLKNKDNIFFLARDGYVPYQLYLKLKSVYPELPKGKYVYASRRAYIYPYLLRVERNLAIETLMLYNAGLGQTLTLREILDSLGLESEKYKIGLDKCNIDSIDLQVDDKTTDKISNFLNFIWEDIEEVLQRELLLLLKYLEQSELTKYDEVNLFDIGWSGSTHHAIKKLLNKEVMGYYFGTIESIHPEIREASFGYAFDKGFPMKRRKFIIDHVMMYELIFSAPEGSLINFELNDEDQIIPNLKNVEQNDYMHQCIQLFQEGAMDVFDRVLEFENYIEDISVSFSLSDFERYIQSYRVKDMLHFSDFTNSVGFGSSKDIKKYVSEVYLSDYLGNRKTINKNGKTNLWKGAILIRDNEERYFNKFEVEKLYNIYFSDLIEKFGDSFLLLKKVFTNPKKALLKIIQITNKLYLFKKDRGIEKKGKAETL